MANTSFTKDQETIVLKILAYKPHQYYEILQVTKSSDETEIKKSYRKLAIKLHPDKNSHPRADEAFKYVNKAWGILSDPSKKKIFDQTGSDPDSRFSGYGNSSGSSATTSGASPFGNGFGGFQGGGGAHPFEDDIFNLFFGGPGRGAGGPTFSFGGNGFTFQSFGDSPFGGQQQFQQRRPRNQQQQQQQQRQQAQQPQAEPSLMETLRQLFPILLIILVPLLSALFSDSSSSVPDYSFIKSNQFNVQRQTPRYNIPYYVSNNFDTTKKLSDKQLKNFDSKVENIYVQDKRSRCSREQIYKNEMIEEAQGWFSTDFEKLKQAESLPMPNCQALRDLNLI
ncbi:hypothetical protein DFJ63DRAFT_311640 [Scheffersomyces coipomensis]|uniref:uncharacterized protein n=1 Tax=Scheffersomyces coipomensis TaxID=1788519 RepID=UPI00315DEF95